MDALRGGFMPGLLGNGAGLIADSPSVPDVYDPTAEAIFAAFTTPPTTSRKALINACVGSLKTAGVWAKLDNLYLLAAADSQAGTINWKTPGSFPLTIVNAPTFTADRGFTGAATKYLDSLWDPATNGVTYTQNSASLHVWNLTEARANSQMVIGYYNGGAAINPWNAAASMGVSVNCNSINTAFEPSAAAGFFSASRTNSANFDVYRNASLLGNVVAASLALVANDFNILQAGGLATTKQIAMGAWGGGLTSTEVSNFYSAIQTYLTGVGVP